MTKLKQIRLIVALIFIIALFTSCDGGTALSSPSSFDTAPQVSEDDVFSTGSVYEFITESAPESSRETNNATTIDSIPKYNGKRAYIAINDNVPGFTAVELVTDSYERYSPLDKFGRCGIAMSCIGRDIMPTEERGNIGSVKPSGWVTAKYDIVDGKYLYNRCHLIGFQLTGENANERNLITGTRYMNVEGMLPFENMIADYVKETNNHVIYRVTPIFSGNNLVCDGVQMEAISVEDKGDGICFNVFAYNVQPGIKIDYATGRSWLDSETATSSTADENETEYVLNTNSKKIHRPTCNSAKDISPKNKATSTESKEALVNKGYSPCKICNP